ncbi:MAG TPA: hypothetical protein VFM25_05075, partial [Verrucomicrobiae bacterium]|nr:hypothetical protein [Verrucomicrobiae bacterium]
KIRNLFQRAGLPVKVDLNAAQRKRLFSAMRLDKKVSGGEIKFVLAERIGNAVWGQRISDDLISGALDFVRESKINPRKSKPKSKTR